MLRHRLTVPPTGLPHLWKHTAARSVSCLVRLLPVHAPGVLLDCRSTARAIAADWHRRLEHGGHQKWACETLVEPFGLGDFVAELEDFEEFVDVDSGCGEVLLLVFDFGWLDE
jgi:hypothetical protein